MPISEREVNGRQCLDVVGRVEGAEEAEELIALLADSEAAPLEVTFYDARVLTGELIAALARRRQRGARPFRVVAYHSFLLHALHRIGVPAVGVPLETPALQLIRPQAIAIGGSADSLDKILHIIPRLPASDVTLFIVQHIQEDKENLLDRLLRVRTEYRVEMPHHMVRVEHGVIYIAPPGHHMKVAHGLVYLTRDRKVNYARPSVDLLFRSLAEEYRERLTAVLLCGYGEDGVEGLRQVRAAGGRTLVECPEECKATHMPENARKARVYDHLFGVAEIAAHLALCVLPPSPLPPDGHLPLLLEALYRRHGYDFRGYHPDSLRRRLAKLESDVQARDFARLQLWMLDDQEFFERFFLEISINVTSFFRHPEQFRFIRERLLPLLETFPRIKIWIAGCATGEEVYSLAILLEEAGLYDRCFIYATDINAYVLELAKGGLFPLDCAAENAENFRLAGGRGELSHYLSERDGYLEVDPRLRRNCLFYHHSLAHDGPFNEFQLILCRNVMIYFGADLQAHVLDLFGRSLHREGFLVIGPQEGLDLTGRGLSGRTSAFEAVERGERVYRLVESQGLGDEGGC